MKGLLFSVSLALLFASSANATVIPVNAYYTLTGGASVTPPGHLVLQTEPLPYTYTIGLNAICNCLTEYSGNMFWWDDYRVDTYSSTDNVLDDSVDTLVDSVTYAASGLSHQFFRNHIDPTNYSFIVFTLLTNNTVRGDPPRQFLFQWDIQLGHQVCSVPLPSAAWLTMSGLGLLGFARRKNNKL